MKKSTTLVAFLVLAVVVQGGLVIETENKMADGSGESFSSTMTVEGKAVRMDVDGAGMPNGGMIYSANAQKMWSIDHSSKEYMEIDKATVSAMAGQMNAAMKQLQEQMANMPAEQREMMAEMMGGRMPAFDDKAKPVEKIKSTGEKKTISGYKCVKHDVLIDGSKKSELWVADWKQLGVGQDAFAVFGDLSDFYGEVIDSFKGSGLTTMQLDPFKGFEELGGFPILVKTFGDNGQLESETLLKSLKKQAVDKNLFQLPAGYRKMTMPGAGGM